MNYECKWWNVMCEFENMLCDNNSNDWLVVRFVCFYFDVVYMIVLRKVSNTCLLLCLPCHGTCVIVVSLLVRMLSVVIIFRYDWFCWYYFVYVLIISLLKFDFRKLELFWLVLFEINVTLVVEFKILNN